MKIPGLILLLVFLNSCERIEYYPDKPIENPQTRILAHKGGGDFDVGDTYDACVYGFSTRDGIEIDLQRSSDNTVWLNHNAVTEPCGINGEYCFPATGKSKILEINSCRGDRDRYPLLEEIFAYMHKNHPDKFISLDVKAWSPCGSGLNITKQMNEMGQAIIDLTLDYHLENHVMIESETGDFLYYIRTHTDVIETYLTAFGDFELGVSRALDAGFSGISFQYKFKEPLSKEQVELMHRKGLKIQLWPVDEPADLEEAKSLGVDFIQTNALK